MAPPSIEDDDATTPLVPQQSSNNNSGTSGGTTGAASAASTSTSIFSSSSYFSPTRRTGSNSASSSVPSCNSCNRFLSMLSLCCIIGIVIYFQLKLAGYNEIQHIDEKHISDLEHIINEQSKIISRFNTSITNQDVIQKINNLEHHLEETEDDLNKKMKENLRIIDHRLNLTLDTLSHTVQDAQNEISSQVDKVKKDVEKYVRNTEDQFSMENSFMVYQLAGTFTLLSGLISMWHMTAHLRKMKQPHVQRKILAILWMCPIYAITSWFSLVFVVAEGYLAIIKDFYEAYIIYQFLSMLIAILGKGDRNVVVDMLAQHTDHLTPPFRLFGLCSRNKDPYGDDKRAFADAVLLQCQSFTMQFVFFRPATTIALFVLKECNYYGPFGATTSTDYRSPQFYIVLIQNLSIFIAFTGLLKFYHAVDKELAWCRPFAKFMCIKGVVFMTFWQGLAISILAETTNVAHGDEHEKWAKAAQNFLICLEMLLFSIAHFYCFPTEEWEPGYKAAHSKGGKFGDSIALHDFLSDLKLVMKGSNKKKKKRNNKKKTDTIPEEGEDQKENDDDGDDEFTIGTTTTTRTSLTSTDEWDEEKDDDDDVEDKIRESAERLLEKLEEGENDELQIEQNISMTSESQDAYHDDGDITTKTGHHNEEGKPTETTSLLFEPLENTGSTATTSDGDSDVMGGIAGRNYGSSK